MPYIKANARAILDPTVDRIISQITNVGEANYAITRILTESAPFTPTRYDQINNALGVLAAVDREYYRRVVVPYEEGKILENGDVFNQPPPKP